MLHVELACEGDGLAAVLVFRLSTYCSILLSLIAQQHRQKIQAGAKRDQLD